MSKKYSMKVYPAGRGRDIYRNIEICGDESLDRLCGIILCLLYNKIGSSAFISIYLFYND